MLNSRRLPCYAGLTKATAGKTNQCSLLDCELTSYHELLLALREIVTLPETHDIHKLYLPATIAGTVAPNASASSAFAIAAF